MSFAELFVRRATARRIALGMSQTALGRRMKEQGHAWYQVTVSRTESGERPLHLDEAESLARVLGLPLVEDGAIMDELAKADALIAAQEAEIARLTRLYSAYRKDVAAAESTISRIRDAVDEHQERRLPSVDDPKSSQVNGTPPQEAK